MYDTLATVVEILGTGHRANFCVGVNSVMRSSTAKTTRALRGPESNGDRRAYETHDVTRHPHRLILKHEGCSLENSRLVERPDGGGARGALHRRLQDKAAPRVPDVVVSHGPPFLR
jgi:hypothetical protein